MPKPAAPPPPPPEAPNTVKSAGAREDFDAPAKELAEKLGWLGQPHWVTNNISVADAQSFLGKTLHEHFQAGALGRDQPDVQAAVDHLGLEEQSEIKALTDALTVAYDDGDGAEVTTHAGKVSSIGATEIKPAAGFPGATEED